MIYLQVPQNFSPRFEIVSCYLEHDGRFVLLHRHENKSQSNKWGVAAGKVENGEDVYDAMVREIREETGLDVPKQKLNYFTKVYVRYPTHDFVYHMFSAKLDSRPIIKINQYEHKNFCWVSPSDALKMDLVEDLDECVKLFYSLK